MRSSLSVVAVVLMLSLVGCSKTTSNERDKRSVGSNLSVFLTSDVTNQERDAVEQKLRAMPSIQHLSLETKEKAYAKFKEKFKDAPDLIAQTTPDSLPESFRATITDSSLAEAIQTAVAPAPGVADVMIVPEAMTPPPPALGIIVQLRKDPTADERTGIEQAIRAIPEAKPATFESSDAAYARLKKACNKQPALASALDSTTVPASYRFTMASSGIASQSFMGLDRVRGVNTVLTVLVSAL